MTRSPERIRPGPRLRVRAPVRRKRSGDVVNGLRSRLAVGTALASMAVVGYGGRGAYAGNCPLIAGTYECSGPANVGVDITQSIGLGFAAVRVTADGTFGIDTRTTGGNALSIFSLGGLSLTDYGHASLIAGADYGIFADNYLVGNLSITSTGQVTGQTKDAIFAYNSGVDLTINAADTSGFFTGIYALNRGTGGISITSSGIAHGIDYVGIFADNSLFGTDLTIHSAFALGYDGGIVAVNSGDGALKVTSTGQTTARNYSGIYASNSVNGSDLIIQSNNDYGGNFGIYAINSGKGELSITSTGMARGVEDDGIFAVNTPLGTDLTIKANNVSGGDDGIDARNYGRGALSITTTGTVNATNDDGIEAQNATYTDTYGNYVRYGDSTDLIVRTEGAVTAGDNGIKAINSGIGELSITATSTIDAGDEGIEAYNSAFGTSLTVETQDSVTADDTGIRTRNYGSGPTMITVSGAVMGGTGDGIETVTGAGGNTIINLNAGANVSATSGVAITNDDGDSATTVNAGASVTGAIRLGNGSDNLTFDGGDFSGVTEFNGGDDSGTADGFVDTLAFRNVAGTVAGANLLNWENVEIGANGALQFSDDALSTMNLNVIDDGTLEQRNGEEDAFALTGDLSVANGGALAFDIFSDTSFDSFSASGMAEFGAGAELDFLFDPLFMPPGGGTELTFFTAAGGITGFGNLSFNFAGLDPLYDAFVNFDDQLNTLSLSFQLKAADVPVPPSVTLLLPGLIGLLGIHGLQRRRSRTRQAAQETGAT